MSSPRPKKDSSVVAMAIAAADVKPSVKKALIQLLEWEIEKAGTGSPHFRAKYSSVIETFATEERGA